MKYPSPTAEHFLAAIFLEMFVLGAFVELKQRTVARLCHALSLHEALFKNVKRTARVLVSGCVLGGLFLAAGSP